MAFRTDSPERVEATAFTRQGSAQEALIQLNYLVGDVFTDDRPYSCADDIYRTYKVTITIEPA